MSAENQREYGEGREINHRNSPGNDSGHNQEDSADQNHERGRLADRSLDISEEHTCKIPGLARLDICEGGGAGNRVNDVLCGIAGHIEVRHMTRERKHQEAARAERGVHEVLTEAAEKLLDDEDREYGAEHRNPECDLRRHVHAEQKSGDDRASI